MVQRTKKETVQAARIRRLPVPEAEPIFPSLEGKIVVFVSDEPGPIPPGPEGAGIGSAKLDYAMFFSMPAIKADILIFRNIQLLWGEEDMERFVRSLSAFRKANPKSAIVVDASDSPLFRGVTRLHEEGMINSIIDSPSGEGKALELGIEILAILRD